MIGYLADAEQALPPFGWGTVASHWQFAPLVTGLIAAAGAAYLCGVMAVTRRHPARPWPWWRTGLDHCAEAV